MRRLAALIAISAALAGCTNYYGTGTSRSLTALPDIDCVTRTIAETEGVDSVEYRLDDLSRARASQTEDALIRNHVWRYEYGPYHAHAYIGERTGYATYRNGVIRPHRQLGEEERALLEPLMQRIDERVAQFCDVVVTEG